MAQLIDDFFYTGMKSCKLLDQAISNVLGFRNISDLAWNKTYSDIKNICFYVYDLSGTYIYICISVYLGSKFSFKHVSLKTTP